MRPAPHSCLFSRWQLPVQSQPARSRAADRRQNAADDADEPARHERGPDERHSRLGRVHGQLGALHLLRQQGRPELHRAAGPDVVHDRLAERRPDVHVLRDRRRQQPQYVREEQHPHSHDAGRHRGSSGSDPLRARARPLPGPLDVEPRGGRHRGVRGLPHPRRRRPGHPTCELVRRDGRRSPAPRAGDDVHLQSSGPRSPAATRPRATRSR